ncbi:hypothetical protein SUDANB145_07195 (plasmid) [Streptomyces sp. enrichment culture]|uniref:hypothetical protein n=1 Tax=Streptomyces sp. enrichment culture TaxID=1795815 RepID=UPI003F542992
MPDPELTDWQYDLGGVVIGADTTVQVIETTGLGRPPVRESDIDQPSMDGQFAGPDYWAGRQIQFDAAIRIPGDPAACHDMVAALQTATDRAAVRLVGGQGMALRIKRPGRPVKRLTVRARKVDPEYGQVIHGYVPLDMEFLAHDPTFWSTRTRSRSRKSPSVGSPVEGSPHRSPPRSTCRTVRSPQTGPDGSPTTEMRTPGP